MKIRNGFVSNSSSSSFTVGLPKGLSRTEKRDLLCSKMGINKDSFFYSAAKIIADCILSADKISKIEQLLNDYSYSTVEDMRSDFPHKIEAFEKCQAKGFDFYSGSASNEDCEIGSQLFCEMGWQVDDEDFFIDKENGF